MALSHSLSIVTNGLVFYYDMGNTQKSWKGKPTTNIANPNLVGMQSIGVTYVGLDNGWKKYSLNGTWNSGTYPFSMAISGSTFTGGVAYSTQIKMKTNVRQKFLTFNDIFYINDPNMTFGGNGSSKIIGSEGGLEIILNKREGFIYSTGYANPTTTQAGYIGSRPISDGTVFNSSTDFVWVKDVQVEEGTFCTPYIDSSRSNTQALLDLTNRSTITATSLSYDSNNSFSFDGANNYIHMSKTRTTFGITDTYSLEAIFKRNNNDAGRIIIGGQGWNWGIMTTTNGCRAEHFYSNDGGTSYNYLAAGNGTAPVGTWTHAVATFNHLGEMRTYINGRLVTTANMSAYTNNWINTNICIGGWGFAGYRFNGLIPIAKVYDRELTASEITQNFNAIRGRYGI